MQQRSIAAVLLSSSLVFASCGSETSKSQRESSKATTVEAGFASRVETVRKQAEALAKSSPGVIVSVRDGNDRKVLAIGDAARNPERKVTPEDTVMIASVTKALVATAALSLVQDGSLRLDDSVEKWLPGLLPKGRQIKVEHLLSMSSGLPNYEDSPDFPGPGVLPPRALVDLIAKEPLDFEPGTQGEQSNTNYAVLQLILERAGHAPLDELLTQSVLKPAGLTHTMLGGTPTALGYDGDQDATIRDPENPSAAAGAVSSVGDVERFLDALTAGKILDAKDTKAMQRGSRERRRRGLRSRPARASRALMRHGPRAGRREQRLRDGRLDAPGEGAHRRRRRNVRRGRTGSRAPSGIRPVRLTHRPRSALLR